MSQRNLKELYGPSGNFYSGRRLGTSGADRHYSSYIGKKKAGPEHEFADLDDLIDDEEEMSNDLLEKRLTDDTGMYRLEATLNRLNEEEGMFHTIGDTLRTGTRIAKAAGKSTILAIPVIDAIAGSMYLMSGITKFRAISDKIIEHLDVPESSFAQAISSDSEGAWQEILAKIEALPLNERDELEKVFEDLLANIKSFILTAVQAYDSALLAAPAAATATVSGPVGPAAVEVGGNLMTGLGSFMAEVVPAERLLFELQTKWGATVEKLFNYITSDDDTGKVMQKANQDGGPIFLSMLKYPATCWRRLGQFYEAVSSQEPPTSQIASAVYDKVTGDPGGTASAAMNQIDKISPEDFKKQLSAVFGSQSISESLKRKSLYTLIEGAEEDLDEDESEEDVSEISAGGVPGVGVPLGHNPDATPTSHSQLKKLRKKQDIYRVVENQNWHHKTSGRIKFK